MARNKYWQVDSEHADFYDTDPDAFVDGEFPTLPVIGSVEGEEYFDEMWDGCCDSCGDTSDYPYCRDSCPTFLEAHPDRREWN